MPGARDEVLVAEQRVLAERAHARFAPVELDPEVAPVQEPETERPVGERDHQAGCDESQPLGHAVRLAAHGEAWAQRQEERRRCSRREAERRVVAAPHVCDRRQERGGESEAPGHAPPAQQVIRKVEEEEAGEQRQQPAPVVHAERQHDPELLRLRHTHEERVQDAERSVHEGGGRHESDRPVGTTHRTHSW